MMLCGANPLQNSSTANKDFFARPLTKEQRKAAARMAAAKSKSKLWGPSHSYDSDDSSMNSQHSSTLGAAPRQEETPRNNDTSTTKWWETMMGKAWQEAVQVVSTHANHASTMSCSPSAPTTTKYYPHWSAGTGLNIRSRSRSQLSASKMEVVKEEAEEEEDDSTDPSTQVDSNANANPAALSGSQESPNTSRETPATATGVNISHTSSTTTSSHIHHRCHRGVAAAEKKVEEWTDLFASACGAGGATMSPCSAHDLEEIFGRQRSKTHKYNATKAQPNLGIAPMQLEASDDEEDSIFQGIESHWDSSPQRRDPPTSRQQQQPSPNNKQGHPNNKQGHPNKNNTSASNSHQISHQPQQQPPPLRRTISEDSPVERRKQRHARRQQRHEQASAVAVGGLRNNNSMPPHEDFEVDSQKQVLVTHPTTTSLLKNQSQLPAPLEENPSSTRHAHPEDHRDDVVLFPPEPLPLETLLVKAEEAQELERNISELTMRSSYQEATHRLSDQRRMAYYAVGRHHRLTGPRSGGNRRCYFTGKLIFGGAPFYAGIVQQGLRSLVVFCLPSTLGMPQNLPNYDKRRSMSKSSAASSRQSLLQRSRRTLSSAASALSKTPSRQSLTTNLDDMSLSIEGDLDPNWLMDKDYLLSILPEPSSDLLAEMAQRYPEQFETLPIQVRHASCWRLFVKFCFFSGLPIQEGELHYQVRPALAMELYGEDIVLSHDVMEAVNGASSADILKLPNRKTFRYLKRHYQQQSAKLPDICFQRTSWERVKPEV
jgi:hypothetical protein